VNIQSSVSLSERSGSKDPDAARPTPIACAFLATILLLLVTFATIPAQAQGCTQCLDSTRATPPAVQAAYRHAIYLLGGAGVTLFLAGLYLLRREP